MSLGHCHPVYSGDIDKDADEDVDADGDADGDADADIIGEPSHQ